jgi:hypothetical protein
MAAILPAQKQQAPSAASGARRPAMKFLLGTHETSWLARVDVPLFISHRRLSKRARLPVASCDWALDSGGFTELNLFGGWRTELSEYVESVQRYREQIGRLLWAAPMDWMCEPFMLAKTGLSVREHQHRTVANYLELRSLGPFIPVLQGWTPDDYTDCIELYRSAGIDLTRAPVVGVGSVCRRQSTAEIGQIMLMLQQAGIRTHGFGVKKAGVARYGRLLASADSLAWSYNARRSPPLPDCTHKRCSNCLRYALAWRRELLAREAWLELDLGNQYAPDMAIEDQPDQPAEQPNRSSTPTAPSDCPQLELGLDEQPTQASLAQAA